MSKQRKTVSGGMYRAVATKHKMLLMKAIPMEGGYILEGPQGERPGVAYVYSSKPEAYKAASVIWPANSVWEGKKVPGGYRIHIG